ncbi:hypothetical protein AXX17_AT2G33280 [Arabidopsis thaliana]|uniref:AT-hook motif nuclear-localized protein n=1 Tax=Arabidopsis thaliana TaxID=3702 RepID=A0A178VTM2_ARATH|nr:hypothetical protein AXX17_AT2G33280 [Arabidopsis thaliana]
MSNSTPCITPFPVTKTAVAAPATVVEGVNDANSTPISPFPVTKTAVAAPATVVEGVNDASRKRERPKTYRDYRGRFITASGTFTPRSSLRKRRGDMSMRLGGGDFTPHSFTVNKGEDIIKRIMSFTANGSRGISVLSVNGAVANVTILPHGSSRRVMTFKEEYEIVSLTNNTMAISESGGVKNKTGGWRITIGGAAGGRVHGGALAGSLIAASPVQVVIGSFWPLITNPRQKRKYVSKARVAPSITPNLVASSSTGPVQQPEMVGPSHSQKRNSESNRTMVVLSATQQNKLASSSTGQVQEPDMIGPYYSRQRNDESNDVILLPTVQYLLASSFTGQVQRQPEMTDPSHSQKRNDESQAAVVPPVIPNLLASSFTGQVQRQAEMTGPSHSQKRNNESQAAVVTPEIPNLLASSFTRQVQRQAEMTGPSHSQKRNDESQAVVVPPAIPNLLASSFTGQVQRQAEMTCPSHSQKRNDESQAVVVPPAIPNLLASSFTGPEMIGPSHSEEMNDEFNPSQFLTLGWYSSTPEQDK